MNCPHCKFVWMRLDICDHLPRHDCSKFQGERPPAKPPRDVILDYLREHPGSTIGEIISSCSGCKDRLAETLRGLVADGAVIEIIERRDNLDWPVYSL